MRQTRSYLFSKVSLTRLERFRDLVVTGDDSFYAPSSDRSKTLELLSVMYMINQAADWFT